MPLDPDDVIREVRAEPPADGTYWPDAEVRALVAEIAWLPADGSWIPITGREAHDALISMLDAGMVPLRCGHEWRLTPAAARAEIKKEQING